MSTTTTVTPNSFGINAPEPTDRMRQAVEHRDAGMSNAQVGEAMNCTSGSAGNLIVNGLRRMGREVATNGGTGGTRAPAAHVPRTRAEIIAAALEQELAKLHTARERVMARVNDANDAVETFDADAWVTDELAKRDTAIETAMAERKAFKANAKANAEARMEALRTTRDELDVTSELAALDTAIAEYDEA